jgi:ABC-type nitrate/sulfonate/bicarbonate transport system substrate-binding protein
MSRSSFVRALFGAALAFALLSRSGHAAETLRVGVAEDQQFDIIFVDVGIAKGFYLQNGLAVERSSFGGGGKAHQALAAGSLDIVLGSGSEMQLAVKGAPEKAVALVMGAPMNMVLVTNADSPIVALADTRDKRVAISSMTSLSAWLAREFSRRQGWGPDGLQLVPLGSVEGMNAGLLTKNVDAMVGGSDPSYVLEAQGRFRVLLSFGRFIPEFPGMLAYASNDLINHKPDEIRAFLRGTFATLAYMKSHREETVTLTMPMTGLPRAVTERVYDEQMPTFSADGHFPTASVELVKRSFVELGLLPQIPDDSSLYTTQFLP